MPNPKHTSMQIMKALESHKWNRMQTAKALGVDPDSLRQRIARMKKAGFLIKDNPETLYPGRPKKKKEKLPPIKEFDRKEYMNRLYPGGI